ncbi:PP2C family protein-serine/threonine phosphatase [Moraxella atlantae]|uniref:PP2C family protein-serine/threonine phosphatase n=1 Tax=Faucicola atlantae TaxID=34059 RepID=UPI0037526AA2
MAMISAKLCAITFQGNASNGLQQDAFFFIDECYHEKIGITPIVTCDNEFCVAVSDGVAESPLSEHASKATVKAVAEEWQAYLNEFNAQKPIMSIERIYEKVANAPRKYHGASATLALLYRPVNSSNQVVIKHIGDSRVYLQRDGKWQFLTRDHNVLNQLLAENAEHQGKTLELSDYNTEGMAGSLYAITDWLMIDSDLDSNPMPTYDSQTVSVQAGDCFVVCTDGVHDLVPCNEWRLIDENTDLQDWLKNLSKQIYHSKGRAYDNATAIVIRFEKEF